MPLQQALQHPRVAEAAQPSFYSPTEQSASPKPVVYFHPQMAQPIYDATELTQALARQTLKLSAGVPLLAELVERLHQADLPTLVHHFVQDYVPVNKKAAEDHILRTLQPLVEDLPSRPSLRLKEIRRLARSARQPDSPDAKRITLMLLVLTAETAINNRGIQPASSHQKTLAPASGLRMPQTHSYTNNL
ncbi:MAG: hypothetical protein KC474_08630 [Cyanobacteria bacterium HKST-UBA04]|nr:hypothetical protein [Cyanobacteria bacterium HKST-UBA04]